MATNLKLGKGFQPRNLRVLGRKNGDDDSLIACYTNDFRGDEYFHIREIYKDQYGCWNPGKQGITMRVDSADISSLLSEAGKLAGQKW